MSLWFRRVAGLDTKTMREIADAAGVSWSAESIVYRANGIGYADGDPADAEEPVTNVRGDLSVFLFF